MLREDLRLPPHILLSRLPSEKTPGRSQKRIVDRNLYGKPILLPSHLTAGTHLCFAACSRRHLLQLHAVCHDNHICLLQKGWKRSPDRMVSLAIASREDQYVCHAGVTLSLMNVGLIASATRTITNLNTKTRSSLEVSAAV